MPNRSMKRVIVGYGQPLKSRPSGKSRGGRLGLIQVTETRLLDCSKPYFAMLKEAGLTCGKREYTRGLKRASPTFLASIGQAL